MRKQTALTPKSKPKRSVKGTPKATSAKGKKGTAKAKKPINVLRSELTQVNGGGLRLFAEELYRTTLTNDCNGKKGGNKQTLSVEKIARFRRAIRLKKELLELSDIVKSSNNAEIMKQKKDEIKEDPDYKLLYVHSKAVSAFYRLSSVGHKLCRLTQEDKEKYKNNYSIILDTGVKHAIPYEASFGHFFGILEEKFDQDQSLGVINLAELVPNYAGITANMASMFQEAIKHVISMDTDYFMNEEIAKKADYIYEEQLSQGGYGLAHYLDKLPSDHKGFQSREDVKKQLKKLITPVSSDENSESQADFQSQKEMMTKLEVVNLIASIVEYFDLEKAQNYKPQEKAASDSANLLTDGSKNPPMGDEVSEKEAGKDEDSNILHNKGGEKDNNSSDRPPSNVNEESSSKKSSEQDITSANDFAEEKAIDSNQTHNTSGTTNTGIKENMTSSSQPYSHRGTFLRVIVQVLTLTSTMDAKESHHHVLMIQCIDSQFIVAHLVKNPGDLDEIALLFSMTFGVFGYPWSISYADAGICFNKARYSENGTFTDTKAAAFGTVENESETRDEFVFNLHENIFSRKTYYDKLNRRILCNLFPSHQLILNFQLKLNDLKNHVREEDMDIQVQLPSALNIINTEGRYYSADPSTLRSLKNDKISAYYRMFKEVPLCNHFHEKLKWTVSSSAVQEAFPTPDGSDDFGWHRPCNIARVASSHYACSYKDYMETVIITKKEEYGYPPQKYGSFQYDNDFERKLAGSMMNSINFNKHGEYLDHTINTAKIDPVGIKNPGTWCHLISAFRFMQEMPELIKSLANKYMEVMASDFHGKSESIVKKSAVISSLLYCTNELHKNSESNSKKQRVIEIDLLQNAMLLKNEDRVKDKTPMTEVNGNGDAYTILQHIVDCIQDECKVNGWIDASKQLNICLKNPSSYRHVCSTHVENWYHHIDMSQADTITHLSSPEFIPTKGNNDFMMFDVKERDEVVHLQDLITYSAGTKDQTLNDVICPEAERQNSNFFRKQTVDKCVVIRQIIMKHESIFKIFYIQRFTDTIRSKKKFCKAGVVVPNDIILNHDRVRVYHFKAAILHFGDNIESGHWVVYKVHNGRYLKISDKDTYELSKHQFHKDLNSLGTVLLYKRSALVNGELKSPKPMGHSNYWEIPAIPSKDLRPYPEIKLPMGCELPGIHLMKYFANLQKRTTRSTSKSSGIPGTKKKRSLGNGQMTLTQTFDHSKRQRKEDPQFIINLQRKRDNDWRNLDGPGTGSTLTLTQQSDQSPGTVSGQTKFLEKLSGSGTLTNPIICQEGNDVDENDYLSDNTGDQLEEYCHTAELMCLTSKGWQKYKNGEDNIAENIQKCHMCNKPASKTVATFTYICEECGVFKYFDEQYNALRDQGKGSFEHCLECSNYISASEDFHGSGNLKFCKHCAATYNKCRCVACTRHPDVTRQVLVLKNKYSRKKCKQTNSSRREYHSLEYYIKKTKTRSEENDLFTLIEKVEPRCPFYQNYGNLIYPLMIWIINNKKSSRFFKKPEDLHHVFGYYAQLVMKQKYVSGINNVELVMADENTTPFSTIMKMITKKEAGEKPGALPMRKTVVWNICNITDTKENWFEAYSVDFKNYPIISVKVFNILDHVLVNTKKSLQDTLLPGTTKYQDISVVYNTDPFPTGPKRSDCYGEYQHIYWCIFLLNNALGLAEELDDESMPKYQRQIMLALITGNLLYI